jgi:hypothetical protein
MAVKLVECLRGGQSDGDAVCGAGGWVMARVRVKPPLTEDTILVWAKAYHARTGK